MYQFTDDCLIGIAQIDEEHRMLFQMINEAHAQLATRDFTVETVKNLVQSLQDYAENHFAHEEAYMQEIDDPELHRQQKEHDAFRAKVHAAAVDRLQAPEAGAVLEELLTYLARWLYHHIIASDSMIGKIPSVKADTEEDVFEFSSKYWTGIAFIDEEHARLFEILREINDTYHDCEHQVFDKYDKILDILDELKEYTRKHFSDEEAYMEKIEYEGLPAQKRAHEAFVYKLSEINLDDIDESPDEYLEELIDYLLFWLGNHIYKTDMLIPLRTDVTM